MRGCAACRIVVEPAADVLHDYVLERVDRRKEYYLERNRLIFVLTAFSGRLLLALAPCFSPPSSGSRPCAAAGLAAREGARLGVAPPQRLVAPRAPPAQSRRYRRVPDRELARFLTPVLDPRMLELPPGAAIVNRAVSAWWRGARVFL